MSRNGVKLEISRTEEISNILGHAKPIKWNVELRGRITRDVVEEISRIKGEPDWMRRLRLRPWKCSRNNPGPIGFR